MSDLTNKINEIDLDSISVADLDNIKNPIIREAVLQAITRKMRPQSSMDYVQHNSHGDHANSA